jgi:hypothetical protein
VLVWILIGTARDGRCTIGIAIEETPPNMALSVFNGGIYGLLMSIRESVANGGTTMAGDDMTLVADVAFFVICI